MTKVVLMLALAAAVALGADATGKWAGTIAMERGGETRDSMAYMVLTQDGSKITGTVGQSSERQFPIKSGSIDGNKIKLEISPDQGPAALAFELTLDGDRVTGTMKGEADGQSMTGKLDLKREK